MHHITKLASPGVPRPTTITRCTLPLARRPPAHLEIDDSIAGHTWREAEVLFSAAAGERFVSSASDHTDRRLEAQSAAISKQVCVKPVATAAWRLADLAGYWDELIPRSWIEENGMTVLYQTASLARIAL